MFSGIIENSAKVISFTKLKDYKLVLETDLKFTDIKKGSSVCCNGICLTVVSKKKNNRKILLTFDVSKETLNCSNFNQIKKFGITLLNYICQGASRTFSWRSPTNRKNFKFFIIFCKFCYCATKFLFYILCLRCWSS